MLATLTFPAMADLRAAPDPATVVVRSPEELRGALHAARDRTLSLDLSALNRMLRLDRRRKRLELQAATSWSSLAAYLSEHGGGAHAGLLAQAFCGSVGDSVSANEAGPDGEPLAVHVEAISLVSAQGELRRADRQTNAGLFRLAVGGHGLLGVLYSVTLRIDSLLNAAARAETLVSLDLAQPGPKSAEPRAVRFFVPPAKLDAVLESFKELAEEHRVELDSVAVRKVHPEHETVLRWATREWASVQLRYAVRPTLGACAHATEIERRWLGVALQQGGSFPIGTSSLPTLAQFEACYPALREFIAGKRRQDPADRFQNSWYRRVSAMLRSEWPAAQASAGAE